MDILTHTLSGVAVATCVATFAKTKFSQKAKTIFAGALGATLPDIDAISMWSRFDSTFGKLFGLSHSGRMIYGSKLWYSHHAFFHSIIASIVIILFFISLLYVIRRIKKGDSVSFLDFCRTYSIYIIAFILGYWTHLLGDIPTPSSVWGGVGAFWPSKNYIGGTGHIWWWNNYDIFLLIVFCIIINLTVPFISKYIRSKSKVFTTSVFAITLILTLVQINTRKFDYAYEGNSTKYAEMEQNSKEEQKRILGSKLYNSMYKLDKAIRINF